MSKLDALLDTPEMRALAQELSAAEQSMVPEDLRAAGWVYRDLPGWITDDRWQEMLTRMGHENYRILIMSHRDGKSRGQFFLSPAAMTRLQQWAAELAAEKA